MRRKESGETTIKISEEPALHVLRNLKAHLTLELDESCSYHDAVLYLIATRALDDKSIKEFVKDFHCIPKTDLETGDQYYPSEREALRQLVEFLVNGMPRKVARDLTSEYFSTLNDGEGLVVEDFETGEISKGQRDQVLGKIKQGRAEFQEIIAKISDSVSKSLWQVG